MQLPHVQPRDRYLLLVVLAAALALVAAGPARGQNDAELVELEAARLYADATDVFGQLLEHSGDFAGYGGAAWELAERLEPSAAALRGTLGTSLFGALGPADAAAARAFWSSATGQRLLWLRREAATPSGVRGLARSARHLVERTAPERLEILRSIDDATSETQTPVKVGEVLLSLIEAAAVRMAGATGEEAEWAEPPSEIRAFLAAEYRDRQFRTLVYLTSRLEAVELREYLDFATSDAGRAYFAARHAAHLDAAGRIVETMLPKLNARLDEELWEYLREEGEAEDEDEEGS